jgi:hypothetical protein
MELEWLSQSSQETSTIPSSEPGGSSPSHPICLGWILILSSSLSLGLPSDVVPVNILYEFISPAYTTRLSYLIF